MLQKPELSAGPGHLARKQTLPTCLLVFAPLAFFRVCMDFCGRAYVSRVFVWILVLGFAFLVFVWTLMLALAFLSICMHS